MQRAVPILHMDGYEEATGYYVHWLGFKIEREFRLEPAVPVYMQVSRDGLVFQLSQHEGDNPGGVTCHVDVEDLDASVAEWKVRRPDFTQKVEISPWNAKHLTLRDPFGSSLGINHLLPAPMET